jgi:hypothetical protein
MLPAKVGALCQKRKEPLDNPSGPDGPYLDHEIAMWIAHRVCYALTTRSCLSEERHQSTPATSSSAGTSPTR